MNKGKKALKVLNIIIVFYFIFCPLLLAVNYFARNETGLGLTFAGMLVVFSGLYWLYGIDYFEVNWLKKKESK